MNALNYLDQFSNWYKKQLPTLTADYS